MGKLEKIKKIWNVIVSEWKTRYRLVFSNEDTHEQSLVIKRITIQKVVVVAILSAFAIIVLTTILIALTPLKMYIPGYTDKNDYKLYKQTAAKVDTIEKQYSRNQQFLDNFSDMIDGKDEGVEDSETPDSKTPDVHPVKRSAERKHKVEDLIEETEKILGRVTEKNAGSAANVPKIEQAKITQISIYPPAMGVVTRLFDPTQNHYGVDITPDDNTVVTCVADGVVIAANYTSTDAYTIIVQHPGNMISIYKHNSVLLKNVGARVTAGMPIANCESSPAKKKQHLHFELWYNGFPINPLNYLVIE